MTLFSLPELVALLILLFLLSAFFSGSETALMALNRYRLRHLAEQGKYSARCAQALLDKPDKLIGLILLGNNLVNILITQLATYLGYIYFQEIGVAVATGLLTVAILVFAEVAPKTLAALHAERVAYPAAVVYRPLLVIAYPLVWLINQFANGLLRVLGMPREEARNALTQEELRSVVQESRSLISQEHRKMLLSILNLEKITVEDVMVPRNEIVGIDLSDDWSEVLDQLQNPTYTRVLVYEGGLDKVCGMLHWRKLLPHILNEDLLPEHIRETMREPYFIPEGTNLNRQLYNFQKHRRRVGLVIDEYGDIQGLVTLEHILEEIVGAFTVDSGALDPGVYETLPDGSVVVDAGIHVRELNDLLDSHFHMDGPRTLNGLILEHLEDIPAPGTSMLIDRYPVEVVKTDETSVRTVRVYTRLESTSDGQGNGNA